MHQKSIPPTIYYSSSTPKLHRKTITNLLVPPYSLPYLTANSSASPGLQHVQLMPSPPPWTPHNQSSAPPLSHCPILTPLGIPQGNWLCSKRRTRPQIDATSSARDSNQIDHLASVLIAEVVMQRLRRGEPRDSAPKTSPPVGILSRMSACIPTPKWSLLPPWLSTDYALVHVVNSLEWTVTGMMPPWKNRRDATSLVQSPQRNYSPPCCPFHSPRFKLCGAKTIRPWAAPLVTVAALDKSWVCTLRAPSRELLLTPPPNSLILVASLRSKSSLDPLRRWKSNNQKKENHSNPPAKILSQPWSSNQPPKLFRHSPCTLQN